MIKLTKDIPIKTNTAQVNIFTKSNFNFTAKKIRKKKINVKKKEIPSKNNQYKY